MPEPLRPAGPSPRRPRGRAAALLAGLAALLGPLAALAGCANPAYLVEQREVPVHVWLTAPDLAAGGGSVSALIYVSSSKVVEGPVRFEPGQATVVLPTAYVRAGTLTVSAVLEGGAATASDRVEVEGEAWVQVIVRGRSASLRVSENQPSTAGR